MIGNTGTRILDVQKTTIYNRCVFLYDGRTCNTVIILTDASVIFQIIGSRAFGGDGQNFSRSIIAPAITGINVPIRTGCRSYTIENRITLPKLQRLQVGAALLRPRCDCRHRQERYRHAQRHQKADKSFLHRGGPHFLWAGSGAPAKMDALTSLNTRRAKSFHPFSKKLKKKKRTAKQSVFGSSFVMCPKA